MQEQSKQFSVLICEDILMNFFVLKQLFATQFPELTVVHGVDGLVGLELAKQQSFDLVITDIEMPNMDGWELIDQLIASGYNRDHIAVISAHDNPELYTNAHRFGISKVYLKPITPDVIKTLANIIYQ